MNSILNFEKSIDFQNINLFLNRFIDSFLETMSEELATNSLSLIVKWSSNEYVIDSITSEDTVNDIKNMIYKKTGVKPERQKLIGLKTNGYSH